MKRSLSLILTVCLVVSLFTGVVMPGAGAAKTFPDVKEEHWGYGAITYMTDKKVLDGDETGKFRPDDKVSHIEFIKMIVATFNLVDTRTIPYTNCPAWGESYLKKAAAQGFLLSSYTTNFDFTSKLTREEAVALVMRYLNLDADLKASSTTFPDYADISAAYREYALLAKGAGIIKGDETGKYQPQRVLTRAEALQILYTAAGAIYDGGAFIAADKGAHTQNATINSSSTITGVAFKGNVYITEGVDKVLLKNCWINGSLYVRGDTEVTIAGDSIVTDVIVNGSQAEIDVEDNAVLDIVNVNATAVFSVEEDATIEKLYFNKGSRNSTVTGEGAVTNIAVQDSGIITKGVSIEEYYIYKGYTATFDDVKYEAGKGAPTKTYITTATVAGTNNLTTTPSSTITLNLKASTAGTFYAAAWLKNTKALSASEIKSVATGYSTYYYGASKAANANVAVALPITVAGSYENYNVGVIFVPTDATTLTNVKPLYNKGAIKSTAASMSTEVPTTAATIAPTWTLTTTGDTFVPNPTKSLILTFDQPMYYKSSTYPYSVTALNTIAANTLPSLFTVYENSVKVTNYSVSVTSSTEGTTVTITPPAGITVGKTYTVSFASLTNYSGMAPEETTKSVVAGQSASTEAPTLTSSSGSTTVSNADYIQVKIPVGVPYVKYTVTVDGVTVSSGDFSASLPNNYTRISLANITGSVVTVSAWSVNASGAQTSATVTETYYMGFVPAIYINGTAYYGTANNVVYTTSAFTVATSTIPSGYIAYYQVDNELATTTPFATSYAAPTYYSSKTLTLALLHVATNKTVTTSVTVSYGTPGGSTTTPSTAAPAPKVASSTRPYDAGYAYDVNKDPFELTISLEIAAGYSYSYQIDDGAAVALTNGASNPVTLTVWGTGLTKRVLTIYAKDINGNISGTWTYSFTLIRK